MPKPCPWSRPIPFSPAMILAVLAGRKTLTRRLPHLTQPKWLLGDPAVLEATAQTSAASLLAEVAHPEAGIRAALAAGVRPRDRRFLWVRESHRISTGDVGDRQAVVRYAADNTYRAVVMSAAEGEGPRSFTGRIRPPMHLPRPFSRLTLEVELVRVQRLQEISREDAIAEGVQRVGGEMLRWENWSAVEGQSGASPQAAFALLWNSINGPEAWAANPPVCAISFTVHHQNIDALLAERGLKEAA